jgi:hypothetical protein
VAKNTRPWPGYRAVSRAAYQKGQMHSHDRAIYRRDGSEEWPYIPGETGWLGGWGG